MAPPEDPEETAGDDTRHQSRAVTLLDPELTRIARIIGIMLIVAGSLTALWLVSPVVSLLVQTTLPFVVGLVFAYIFDPIVTFVQRQLRLSRIGGVLVLYALFVLALTGFFALVLPILVEQIQRAWTGLGGFLTLQVERLDQLLGLEQGDAQGTLTTGLQRLMQELEERGMFLDDLIAQAARSDEVRSAARSGFGIVGEAIEFFYGFVTGLIGGVTFFAFAILVNIYLLLDFSKLRDVMEVMIPPRWQERTFDVLGKVDVAVGGFIRGMLITAFLVGLLSFVGFYLLGLSEYALLFGILAGVGNLIPYLGPISGGGPALLYVLFSDAYGDTQERIFFGIGVIVVVAIVQTLEGFVFQPRIVGQSAQLHPVAVLFALALGANFGLVGMILAVPAAAITRVLLKEFYWDRRETAWKEKTGKRFLGDWRRGRRRRKRKDQGSAEESAEA